MGSSLSCFSPYSPFAPPKRTREGKNHQQKEEDHVVNHENSTLVHVLPQNTTQEVTNVIPEDPPLVKPKKSYVSLPEGGSSDDPTIFCKICMESTSVFDSFSTQTCSHLFCSECISHYIASKVEENSTVIRCPKENCEAVLEPELCRSIIPPQVFDKWCKILCEESISMLEKLYCPYKDCSALLFLHRGQFVIAQVKCPHCCRLFCAQCKAAPWHEGTDCADYQKLGLDEREKGDIQLSILAKNMRWVRCPKCGYFIERTRGCNYMVCRCKHRFCYKCGGQFVMGFFQLCNC